MPRPRNSAFSLEAKRSAQALSLIHICLAVLEIDAVQVLDERRHEVLARLFAIADDVDARVLLFLQRQAQGILFALEQSAILQFPGRPQGLGLSQPGGFRQAAGGGGGKQFFHNDDLMR